MCEIFLFLWSWISKLEMGARNACLHFVVWHLPTSWHFCSFKLGTLMYRHLSPSPGYVAMDSSAWQRIIKIAQGDWRIKQSRWRLHFNYHLVYCPVHLSCLYHNTCMINLRENGHNNTLSIEGTLALSLGLSYCCKLASATHSNGISYN